jgi:hypothetical protein
MFQHDSPFCRIQASLAKAVRGHPQNKFFESNII